MCKIQEACNCIRANTLPAQLHCAHSTGFADVGKGGWAPMLGLPVELVPLGFNIYEANLIFMTETSCVLLNFKDLCWQRVSY